MLGIILTVLKILLWIVLAVIGLVILCVLTVCLVPVRYSLSGEFYEKKTILAKVRWIFVSVTADNKLQDSLYYRIKLFGKTIITNDEAYLSEKSAKKARKKKRDKKTADENAKTKEITPVAETDMRKEEITPVSEAAPPAINTDGQEGRPAEQTDKSDTQEGRPAEQTDKSDTQDRQQETKDKKAKEKKPDKEKKNIIETLKEKAEFIRTKKDHIIKFLDKPFTKHTIQLIKKAVIRIIKAVKPKKVKGEITYGMKTPADTGKLTGGLSLALPLYYGKINLVPDFHQRIFEGYLDIKGSIRIGAILLAGLGVITRRYFWRTKKLAEKI